MISALFHYLGPSFAVLLFANVSVLGVALLRVWSAALAFTLWRRPWRFLLGPDRTLEVWALGAILALMNLAFYLAIARLPLATVGTIEFLGTVSLAAYGVRSRRNLAALALTVSGIAAITEVRLSGNVVGFAFAFANCALFVAYVTVAHRVAQSGAGVDRLAASMLVAAACIVPIGIRSAIPAFSRPALLAAGAGVGICSSVVPYVTDQLAMARLPRATFALMPALLPVFATAIGAVVLKQVPSAQDVAGIALVSLGIALHRQEES